MLKKLLCVSAGVVAVSIACAVAGDAPAKPKHERKAAADAPKPELKEMTVSGTISKQESKNKAGEAVTTLILTSDDGSTIRLPPSRKAGKDAAGAINLEEYVGVKVKLTGMGYEKDTKGGKKMIALSKITNVEKIADQAPAAAPAAPAK